MKELTPLQEAKRRNEPYVMLVIDRRHIKDTTDGKVTVEGPVSKRQVNLAIALFQELAKDE